MYILLSNEILYIDININNEKLDTLIKEISNIIETNKNSNKSIIYIHLCNLIKKIRINGIYSNGINLLRELSKFKYNKSHSHLSNEKYESIKSLSYDELLNHKQIEDIILAYADIIQDYYIQIIDCFNISINSNFVPVNVNEFVNDSVIYNKNTAEREKNKNIYLNSISNTSTLNRLGLKINNNIVKKGRTKK